MAKICFNVWKNYSCPVVKEACSKGTVCPKLCPFPWAVTEGGAPMKGIRTSWLLKIPTMLWFPLLFEFLSCALSFLTEATNFWCFPSALKIHSYFHPHVWASTITTEQISSCSFIYSYCSTPQSQSRSRRAGAERTEVLLHCKHHSFLYCKPHSDVHAAFFFSTLFYNDIGTLAHLFLPLQRWWFEEWYRCG